MTKTLGYLFDDVNGLSHSIASSIQDLENNNELIQKKLFNIEKKLEKSSKEIYSRIIKKYMNSQFELIKKIKKRRKGL